MDKEQSKDNKRKTITVAESDHCSTCPWLDKQKSGNRMLCILPGECFWLDGWRDNGAIKQTR